ncbi:MAG: UDP-N-acetylmuramoyl-tripeptide--D-alanyl-D-alanine ligase [Sphingomonadales bacterium]|jgi:UDP-N-acetylmuramoyl-tripeptide--D-alanyl-D-alanine ligase|nr:UDP-N-acetylmuramoyl-tripeptide--D-alanyl-D-alanine ligase [Sphingomonadales bacterium]MBK9004052.1 UDP-N-acetylmuramoyl-tripeptide--D-alanyl-D-alanine ligase [Sphingomonadales bacterium]MBK9269227.1 UDP-N-acetylmuramoyl-tripeptide--D-alanyl-D-alanine ligase [Sphingomonadales bacterium]MBP6433757.1 UDP-N-acetylmuramoyl-tripeptide--D-alanyl-D-alanine ligase [Sphingorhabdus sp.]
MSPLWTSAEIVAATGGTANADFECNGVAFDSREIGPGDLFFAMKGEQADGHRFVAQAFASGASGAVVSAPVDGPHILVADTMRALEQLGIAARQRVDAKIVGVTGSAGKTGTKEALFAALERCKPGKAHRSVKSYNNHVGVPLSLARMPRESEYGVFEMGMNHEGELAALTQFVRPHVTIVTTIAPAHIEHFGSEDRIADAKAEIFEGLEPGGVAILPADSLHFDRLRRRAEKYAAKIIGFGFSDGADVRCIDHLASANGGSLITAKLPGGMLQYELSQPGDHWVANSLAVLAAVQVVGADLAVAGLALADMGGLKGRGARHRLAAAGGEAILIDESYNANPASMTATLKGLGNTNADRRIAVLGAMRELGGQSARFHAKLRAPIEAANVNLLLLVGEEMAPLVEALAADVAWAGKFAHCASVADVSDRLRSDMRGGDAILIKGSNSVGLSAVVEALLDGGD